MKKLFTVITLVALLIATSCKESKKEEEPSRMEQVIDIHDEVMPKMGTLGKLVGQLKPMADSLGVESLEAKAMKDLQLANKSMMDWMQGFGNRFDYEETMNGKELSEEKEHWLKEEEEKVKKVKEDINSSIERAEEILKKQ
jgi:hypothetical protein